MSLSGEVMMLSQLTKLFHVFLLLFSAAGWGMEPLKEILPEEDDYEYYMSVIRRDHELVRKKILTDIYVDYNVFDIRGSIVPISDGSPLNPINMVMTVNGHLYYVDTILSSIKEEKGIFFKARRRWKDNPEPGLFFRIVGTRVNSETGETEEVHVWIKAAAPDGTPLNTLTVWEGNFDIEGM